MAARILTFLDMILYVNKKTIKISFDRNIGCQDLNLLRHDSICKQYKLLKLVMIETLAAKS